MRRAARRSVTVPALALLGAAGCGTGAPPGGAAEAGGLTVRAAAGRAVDPGDDWRGLVAAESAFAARAGEVGISPAFLEVLARDGIVFAPGPVSGRTEHTERPVPRESYLRWHPRLAGVSRAGDLGYTTGPWVAGRGEGPPGASGHYLSVWGADGDGWELLVDVGISHPPLDDQEVRRPAVDFPERTAAPDWTRAEAERSLAERQQLLHMVLSVDAAVHPMSLVRMDALALVEGDPPRDAVFGLSEVAVPGRAWDVRASGIARSLDLAYSWGTVTRPGVEGAGNFLEVWTAGEGRWELALFLLQGS